MLLVVASVLAGAPSAVVTGTGSVEGSVSLTVAPTDLRAKIAEPGWVRNIVGGSTVVVVKSRDGGCVTSDMSSPSAVMTVRYTVRQCPTATGYRSTLVASEDFSAYQTDWIVAPEGTGSLLTYRIQLSPTMPFPNSLVTGTLRREVQTMMDRFYAVYGLGK